ncbi:MAG: N-acetyltransferase, partial [Bacteroidetes bacterium]|nr:N-acetyltransferase [Bacteroidota bacterium]
MNIQHEDNKTKGRFFVNENGIDLAQMVYSWAGTNLIIIEHTEVDDQLKGQGVGNKLVAASVDWART